MNLRCACKTPTNITTEALCYICELYAIEADGLGGTSAKVMGCSERVLQQWLGGNRQNIAENVLRGGLQWIEKTGTSQVLTVVVNMQRGCACRSAHAI